LCPARSALPMAAPILVAAVCSLFFAISKILLFLF
jgi:hypothetical protein